MNLTLDLDFEETSIANINADEDALPVGVLRRVIITERSEELLRIHNAIDDELANDYLDSFSDDHAPRHRSLLARVVGLAFEDIATGMRRADPRYIERRVRGETIRIEDSEFRSAVNFFFGQNPVLDDEGMMGWYSALGAYTQLMEMNAARMRKLVLERFDGLEEIVKEIIPNIRFRAPIGSSEMNVKKETQGLYL